MGDGTGRRASSDGLRDSPSVANEPAGDETPCDELPRVYEFGPFRLNPTERTLQRDGNAVALTPKAFDTLHLLVQNSGHLLEKDELINRLWPETFVEEGSLSNSIFLLRKALGEDPAFIETVPRRGYRFVGAVRRFPEGSPALGQAKEGPARRLSWWTVPIWILSSVACVLAALAVYPKFRSSAQLGSLAAAPFAAYAGVEGCPAFSPDGSQLAFSWNGDPESQLPRSAGYIFSGSQSSDLYIKVIGSENLMRLTHHPSEYICPAWSPNGGQIAFHRMAGADTGLYVVAVGQKESCEPPQSHTGSKLCQLVGRRTANGSPT